MKITYSDETIDALLVKALAVHFDDFGPEFGSQTLETQSDSATDLMTELPETYAELEKLANDKRVRRAILLTPFLAMNRDQSEETYDETTEEDLRRAREEARARIIGNKADPESE